MGKFMDVSIIFYSIHLYSYGIYIFILFYRCNKCNKIVDYKYVNNILDRAGKDLEAMEKGNEKNCLRYDMIFNLNTNLVFISCSSVNKTGTLNITRNGYHLNTTLLRMSRFRLLKLLVVEGHKLFKSLLKKN